MLRNKLMTACSVAVLTVALYGCSSSSDDGANTQVQGLQDQISALGAALEEGQELTPETIAALVSDLADAEADLETAKGRVTDLETMIGAEMDPAADSLRGMLAQANMDLTDANSKLEMAMDNSADETVITDLRQDVIDAETMRDNYKMMLDTAKADLVTVTGERDTARTDLAGLKNLQDQISALEAALEEGQELTPETIAALVSDLADAEADLETAKGRVTDLETMIGAEMDPAADSLRGMLAQANMDLTDANSKLEMAMDNSADETVITDLRQDVIDAETMRDNYKMMLDTAKADLVTVAGERDTARTDLEELKKDASGALAAVAKADRIARAYRIIMAIATEPGGLVKMLPAAPGVATPAITRNVARMMTVDVNGEDEDAYAGGETTAGSGDWNSFMLAKTNNEGEDTESTDIVMLYTDIDAPSDKKFIDKYGRDAVRDDMLGNDDRVKLAASSYFPSGATETLEYSATSGNPISFAGTFDSVPGTYECTAVDGSCTLMTDADSELEMAEGWRFTPNDNLATVKDPDAAYAWFGWWLNKPKEADAMHMVEVFAGGSMEHAADVLDTIEGTATYSGPVAGKYATRTFTADVQTDAAAGHFTANTRLTAKFGDDDEPGSGISGSVSGFVLDDTTPASWSVTLETAMFTTSATFNGTTEVNFGGGATDNDAGETHPGAWQGSFYGAATDDSDAPNTVVGTFGAATDDNNASVIGAFGATKQ